MRLTPSQTEAVQARGNVIVVAGAGTGKTSTLVERCLDVVREGSSLDRILMVTFTEAAAAEMRHRLRQALQQLAETPGDASRFAEQLALVETAKISTIHSFCLRLVQAHFHDLGLDPEVKVLDDQQCRLLLQQTLDDLFEDAFAGKLDISEATRALISAYAPDRDGQIRDLVVKLHRHTQSLNGAERWIREQQALCADESPRNWEPWLATAFLDWREEWRAALDRETDLGVFKQCLQSLRTVGTPPTRTAILSAAEGIVEADGGDWEKQKTRRRKPFEKFFDDAAFLASVAAEGALEADWAAVREHLHTLLALTAEFTRRFTAAKRELGGVDFPDLEQLALRLLLHEDGTPTDIAGEWQARLDYVFVDECQDINGAQDAILAAVSRSGPEANRFLVGDVKQSIYRFRLANPDIFRNYEAEWSGSAGRRIPLAENFRSRPGILDFVNALFPALMRGSVGGVHYEPLVPGAGSPMADLGNGPCVELHFLRKTSDNDATADEENGNGTDLADLSATEREARLVAWRLRELKESRFEIWDKAEQRARAVEWRDMAILMRSPGTRTEVFAKVFHQCGIPLEAERAGFLEAVEIRDLVSLLKLLDNPVQDIPLVAVLRSPLVGLTLDELALIRAHNDCRSWWELLQWWMKSPAGPAELRQRVAAFLSQFEQWREWVRQVGPSLCLEQVLADTDYDVLLAANERGAQQLANVRQLLDLARQFDPYLRQGLHRFLRFLKALDDAEDSLEPAPPPSRDAVRLMSIHKSKGLEFPVVALAGLGTKFNFSDQRGLILLDEAHGLTAKAMTRDGAGRYPTLPFWLAERRQRAQTLGEELRLLYVAMTRARDRLICTGVLPRKDQGRWESAPDKIVSDRDVLSARQPVDWLYGWLPGVATDDQWDNDAQGKSSSMTWELWDPRDSRLDTSVANKEVGPDDSTDGATHPATVEAVAARVSRVYPHEVATTEPAKSSVSALRRRAVELADEDAVQRFAPPSRAAARSGSPKKSDKLTAAERGVLHHRFLEQMNVESALEAKSLAAQAATMVQRGVFTQAEAAALDLNALAAFWASEVGGAIREHAVRIRRELPFTVRLDDAEVRAVLGQPPEPSLAGEFVVVQGIADLAVLLDEEIWLLDFKTDDVKGEALQARAKEYTPQLKLYALALERIFQRPVRHRWLHFLSVGETVTLA